MQDTLFLAEAATQDDWLNTLFLVLALGTGIAALIWLLLWLVWWGDSDDESGDDRKVECERG
ncbi:hypothetical protein N9B21_00320 [Verrucomicrobiales bacterium]|nr:hypothetical protein [Verrucomicrobiales bacterium]MDA7926462.1 hypothetical protein [Verrucomicrobiales bacterium]